MKNLTRYVLAFAAAGFIAASCDINKLEVFDDANAFVAFDKASATVAEVAGNVGEATASVSIPVTLASVAGIETKVTFRLVEGTAKEGVNYSLAASSASGVLSFNAENRTAYIDIDILYDGEYTGDISFGIEFADLGSVTDGAANTCSVTITDVDHPLSALFGTYTMSGYSYWDGDVTWTATIYSDPDDDARVYILNLPFFSGGWENAGIDYYGTVDADMTTITIPFGQGSPSYSYNEAGDILLLGIDAELNDYDTGNLIATIEKDDNGNITGLNFGNDYGVWCYINNTGSLSIVLPGMTATKD